MPTPKTEEFIELAGYVDHILFEIYLSGATENQSTVQDIRWVLCQQGEHSLWQVVISSMTMYTGTVPQRIASYLEERGYEPENIEIIVEDDHVAV